MTLKRTTGKRKMSSADRGTVVLASSARRNALKILESVRRGQFAESSLSMILDQNAPGKKDRALTTELVYGVLRWRDRLDSIIHDCLDRPEKKIHPHLEDILRIAFYQVFFLNRIPHRAIVHEAVTQAREISKESGAAFVNAVIRRALREMSPLDPPPGEDSKTLSVYYSHPEWLVKRWIAHFGTLRTSAILCANNSRPPLIVRVNRLKASGEKISSLLDQRGISGSPTFPEPDALKIESGGGRVQDLPGFAEGFFVVQESASQLVAPLLRVRPGERILDACSAPGGKTSHIAALSNNQARIVATDLNPQRLEETLLNLARLGVDCAEFRQGDAGDPGFVRGLGMFERIVLDAPCSNLGVLRHNPEARYRVREEGLVGFAQKQLRLMNSVSNALAPGGTLLYSVCTVTPEETTGVVTQFLDMHEEFLIDPIGPEEVGVPEFVLEEGFLRTFPPSENNPVDGFFAARMRRTGGMCE